MYDKIRNFAKKSGYGSEKKIVFPETFLTFAVN